MLQPLLTLMKYKDLLWLWILRNIKIKYKQSAFGILWSIIQPFSLMVIFTVVFSLFTRVDTGNIPYPLFSYCALLPWTFFSTSLSFGITSITNNINLVTKIYFPREILPIAVVAANFFDFLIALFLFGFMLALYRIPLGIPLFFLPVLLIIQIILTLGIVMFVSAINVFFRDVQFVVPLAIQLLMFASPIVYPVTVVPERFRWLYMLNPLASLVQSYRDITLLGIWPNWTYFLEAAIVSSVIFVSGYFFFKKVEWQFADII